MGWDGMGWDWDSGVGSRRNVGEKPKRPFFHFGKYWEVVSGCLFRVLGLFLVLVICV